MHTCHSTWYQVPGTMIFTVKITVLYPFYSPFICAGHQHFDFYGTGCTVEYSTLQHTLDEDSGDWSKVICTKPTPHSIHPKLERLKIACITFWAMVDSKEENFLARIRSSIATVESWGRRPIPVGRMSPHDPF